jgi:hypothetical protein
MKSHSVELEFVTLEVPGHWGEWSHEREQDERITRLIKENSYYQGLLEVRARRYRPGRAPKASTKHLFKDLVIFTQDYVKRWIGCIREDAYDVSQIDGERLKMAAASFDALDDVAEIGVFLRVWHMSDGRHFVYVIYRSENWHESLQLRQQELKECDDIISSITFKK